MPDYVHLDIVYPAIQRIAILPGKAQVEVRFQFLYHSFHMELILRKKIQVDRQAVPQLQGEPRSTDERKFLEPW